MPNELILPDGIEKSKFDNPQALAFINDASASYLSRIQVMGSSNEAVKSGKFKAMGHFGLYVGNEIRDLGDAFDAYVVAFRPKAMTFAPSIESYYDPQHPEFIKIQERCDNVQQPQAGYGPEYLLYVPAEKAFATFFLSNKSLRREAPTVQGFLNKTATFKCVYIKGKGKNTNSWHSAEVVACLRDLDPPEDQVVFAKTVNKFNNPPVNEVETAEAGSERAR